MGMPMRCQIGFHHYIDIFLRRESAHNLKFTEPDSLSLIGITTLFTDQHKALLLSYLCLIVLKRELLTSIAFLPFFLPSLTKFRFSSLPCSIDGYIMICVGFTSGAIGSHILRDFHVFYASIYPLFWGVLPTLEQE